MPFSFQQLHDYIELEYRSQAAQTLEMWEQPVAARVQAGEAVAGLQVLAEGDNRLQLRCRQNISRFRSGDYLRLNRGDPKSESIKVQLEADRGLDLVVRAGYQANLNGVRGNGWVLDRDSLDLRSYSHGIINQLADGSGRSREVVKILSGLDKPDYDPAAFSQERIKAMEHGLNPAQAEAYTRSIAARNFYLVQGPPGTGKTHVLARIAADLASRGERVLISAFTHRAINNALRKTAQLTGFTRLAKIGQTENADDLAWDGGRVPNYEYVDRCPLPGSGQGYILGGTAFALRTNRLKDTLFDTVIFDESGQLPIHLAASGMLAARRSIFIGDHKQMAPIVTAQHPVEWVTRSVFETLFPAAPGTMLDMTYRMNEEINAFPSKRFYGGKLKPAPEAASRRLVLTGWPGLPGQAGRAGRYADILAPEPAGVFVPVLHSGAEMRAPEEAEIAAGLVAEAVACGLAEKEVAVVAPFRAQVRMIRSALQELGIMAGGEGVVVDTVERIQGQERDMIIISLTTSSPEFAAAQAEFYFQPNRLNVAITRARVKRVVLGSPVLFEARPASRLHRQWVEHFRELYEQSYKISAEHEMG